MQTPLGIDETIGPPYVSTGHLPPAERVENHTVGTVSPKLRQKVLYIGQRRGRFDVWQVTPGIRSPIEIQTRAALLL